MEHGKARKEFLIQESYTSKGTKIFPENGLYFMNKNTEEDISETWNKQGGSQNTPLLLLPCLSREGIGLVKNE
jgi:hypothetical protein